MILHPMILSTTEPNNSVGVIKARQGDNETQTFVVTVTEHSKRKNFTGYEVFFCIKTGTTKGIIENKVTTSGEIINAETGQFNYTLTPYDWQRVGVTTAYFDFRISDDHHNVIKRFSTRDFNYTVTGNSFSDGFSDSNYVWTFEDLLRMFQEWIANGQGTFEEWFDNIKDLLGTDPAGELAMKIGFMNKFRYFDESLIDKMSNEFAERGVNIKTLGAKSEGASGFDNTEIVKQAIELTPSGGTLLIPNGNYRVSETLKITKPITIRGANNTSCILNFYGCSGFEVSSNAVSFENVRIYSTSVGNDKERIGIKVANENNARNDNFYMNNVDVSRFDIGLEINSAWNFNITNTLFSFVKKWGIHALGKSVNNNLNGVRIIRDETNKVANNKGIFFDGSVTTSEGWMLTNCLIYGFQILIHSQRMSHVLISNSILDYAREKAILLDSYDINVSVGWQISNNYIATEAGLVAIHDNNNAANVQHGNFVSNNKILDYLGTGGTGVLCSNKAVNNSISTNRILGYSVDIDVRSGQHIVTGNLCLSNVDTGAFNIISLENSLVSDNLGKSNPANNSFSKVNDMKLMGLNGANLPNNDVKEGDFVFNTRTTFSNVIGWRRTEGIWKPLSVEKFPIVSTLPTASAALRGQFYMIGGGGGVNDKCYVCVYYSTAYQWKEIAFS